MAATTAPPEPTLTGRDRAILRAVAAGTAELTPTADLVIDGRFCCDQLAAQRLARAGLIAAVEQSHSGQRAPAVVTAAGRREMGCACPPGGVGCDACWAAYLHRVATSATQAA